MKTIVNLIVLLLILVLGSLLTYGYVHNIYLVMSADTVTPVVLLRALGIPLLFGALLGLL